MKIKEGDAVSWGEGDGIKMWWKARYTEIVKAKLVNLLPRECVCGKSIKSLSLLGSLMPSVMGRNVKR